MRDHEREIAERVRDACARAARDGYHDAAVAGLCHEGAAEAAVGAIRMLDLAALVAPSGAAAAAPGEARVRAGPDAVGAEVDGVDLAAPLDDATFARIRDAVDAHAVVVLRGQSLGAAQQVALGRRFGKLQVNVRAEANSGEDPEIFWVSNITRDGKPVGSHDAGRYWHSDLCYLERPSHVTMLYAVEVPVRDGVALGDTCFASASAAYEALPAATKRRIEGLRAANGYRRMWKRKAREFGQRPDLDDAELERRFPPDAVHPVVRTHPATGRRCLYVCEGYTHRILDLDEAESDALLAELFEHATRPEFVHRHRWQAGDLLIWDNCAVQHRASFDYEPPLRRLMRRCTVEGGVPY